MMRILTIFGTRPEAIKLAPVVKALESRAGVEHRVCVTGQHRHMLDQALKVFALTSDYDLDVMKPGQDLAHVTTAVLDGIGTVIDDFKPDWVIVQGDTTTAFAGALAAFYSKVNVAHVEAGLRTGNILSPWPEEMNRKLISQITSLHFPPTESAAINLRREGVRDEALLVTGNTVIDALQLIAAKLDTDRAFNDELSARFDFLDPAKRLILVTGHRRENLDGGLERVCQALLEIGKRDDVQIVYPVHLNPLVKSTADALLSSSSSIHLIEPQEYLPFIYLMKRSYLIVTDSGGIQEEAPGLGKPVLVTRDTTERPEVIASGTGRLVGTSTAAVVSAIMDLLDNRLAYEAMAQAKNPFGDGQASARIVDRLIKEI